MGASEVDSEKELRLYQKLALCLFYPSLLNFFAMALASSLNFFSLSFAGAQVLDGYLLANLVAGNEVLTQVVILLIGVALVLLFGFFTLMAVKGKLWPIIAATALYFMDFVYSIVLYFPVFGQMSLVNWIVSLVLHVAFLTLDALILVKYVKLTRLLRKEEGQR
jgi:hypothetical protein